MLSGWDIAAGKNLSACHRCELMQSGCRGACACLQDGRDIIEHAQAGDCPLGKHEVPPSRGLGDTIAKVAHALGADKAAHVFERLSGRECGCGKRREKLNDIVRYSSDR
jgi:hypothetical protein